MFTEKDYLRVEGGSLVNGRGEKIVLKGTNLGGWLHREGWMDGCGACLLTVPVVSRRRTEEGLLLSFPKISRCNRFAFSGPGQAYQIWSSLDGERWELRAKGSFSEEKRSQRDHGRPAPYAPGVNVYDEGVFVQDGVIHTNEFPAKFVRIAGVEDAEPMRYGDVDDFQARRMLEARFGKERAEELLAVYQACYLTRRDLAYIKSLGANLVRTPVYWQEVLSPDGSVKENAWENLDWLVEQCRELEIYIMLDYHGAPGGNTMGSITAGQLDSNELWLNDRYQEMSCAIWREISRRYGKEPAIAAYDLLNEPCAVQPSFDDSGMEEKAEKIPSATLYFHLPDSVRKPVRKLYQKFYQTLEEAGDQHIRCMQLFADLELLQPPAAYGWENVMYQVHCYPLGDFRNREAVARSMRDYAAEIRKYRKLWQVPVFAGEFCCWEFEEVWEQWLGALEELGIHWANWSYKITDPVRKDNWSLWYAFDGVYVDYQKDSEAEIRKKWSGCGTEHYQKNEVLEGMLRAFF